MTADCLNQYACLAANINFNVDGLLKSFWQLTIDGLSWGAIYALVAVGYTLVFGVLRLINFAHSEIFMLGMFGAYFCLDMILGFTPSGNAYNKGVLLTVFYLGIAMLFAMLVSGSAAVGLEFVAYRPLRRRNARPLTFLITAIGMSFVIQEFVHFILPQIIHGYGGNNAQQPIILVQPKVQFSVLGAHVTNVTIVIIGAALVFALLTDIVINRTKFGRGIRGFLALADHNRRRRPLRQPIQKPGRFPRAVDAATNHRIRIDRRFAGAHLAQFVGGRVALRRTPARFDRIVRRTGRNPDECRRSSFLARQPAPYPDSDRGELRFSTRHRSRTDTRRRKSWDVDGFACLRSARGNVGIRRTPASRRHGSVGRCASSGQA